MATTITPITHSDRVERLLLPYRTDLGDDFAGYRNHIYRVLSYAMHFLNGADTDRQMVETVLVYHDLGLWTAGDLAYLEPSEALALKENAAQGWGLDPDVLRAAIHWHHKVFPYAGKGADVVNAVRRADWIDATQGKVRHGVSKGQIAAVAAALPDEGFYDTLTRLAGDLNGGRTFAGLIKVLRRVYKI
ncbi:MAG: phosphohydrolase [Pseudomonadota bacterium]